MSWSVAGLGVAGAALLIGLGVGFAGAGGIAGVAAAVAYVGGGAVGAVLLFDAVLRRKLWTFDRNAVLFISTGPLRHTSWQEPLTEYAGVLTEAYEGPTPGRFRRAFVTRHKVLLRHKQVRLRDVCFYDGPNLSAAKETEQEVARLFSKPVLTSSARDPEELRRETAARPVPQAINVQRDQDGMVLTGRPTWLAVLRRVVLSDLGWPGILLAGGLYLASALIWSFEVLMCILGGVVAVAAALGIGFCVLSRLGREQLSLEPGCLAASRRWPWGPGRVRTVPAQDIQHVCVHSRGLRGAALEIITKDGSLWWGMGQPVETLEWVRDCIIAVISR
jgi:hypothetical protein